MLSKPAPVPSSHEDVAGSFCLYMADPNSDKRGHRAVAPWVALGFALVLLGSTLLGLGARCRVVAAGPGHCWALQSSGHCALGGLAFGDWGQEQVMAQSPVLAGSEQERARPIFLGKRVLPWVVFSWGDLEIAGDGVVWWVAQWLRDLVLPRAGRCSPTAHAGPEGTWRLEMGLGLQVLVPLVLLSGLLEPLRPLGQDGGPRGTLLPASLRWDADVQPGWGPQGWPPQGGQRVPRSRVIPGARAMFTRAGGPGSRAAPHVDALLGNKSPFMRE